MLKCFLVLIVTIIGSGLAEESPDNVCLAPVTKGPCIDYLKRYAYDEDRGVCIDFRYGGCGGTSNNFKTLEDCEETCVPS